MVGKSDFECDHLFTVLIRPFLGKISLDRKEFKPLISEWGAAVVANHPGNLNLNFRLGELSLTQSKHEEHSYQIDMYLFQ